MPISSVSIIGSGNLANHLALALYRNQIKITNVYSRNFNNATVLARQVDATPIKGIHLLEPADLIIICVSDSVIAEINNSLKVKTLVVHTSGSTSIDVLTGKINYGVIYPFQTFSKDVDVDFSKVPVFVEANTQNNASLLKELAEKVSANVRLLNSKQRLKLHLSAVFANNFSNHMYAIAREILLEANLPFELLSHLIEETTAKALKSGDPVKVQTGPAVRGNFNIMEQHKEILAHRPLWQKIYTFVSNSIMERETDKHHGAF